MPLIGFSTVAGVAFVHTPVVLGNFSRWNKRLMNEPMNEYEYFIGSTAVYSYLCPYF
jgi:hypothetical protein